MTRSVIHRGSPNVKLYSHGGDVYGAARELGIPVSGILDFSASINPLGVPEGVRAAIAKSMNMVVHYPDPECSDLRREIASRYGIDPATILCGNGSTELIYLLPRVLRPANVLVTAPAFSEYERACRQIEESGVKSYELIERNDFHIEPDEFIREMRKCVNSKFKIPSTGRFRQDSISDSGCMTRNSAMPNGMAFLCNPNNPTGHLLKRDAIVKIADAARDMKLFLVVDEAFIDFVPGESVINDVKDNPFLIVLRSMTKFYALTGLRVGFGVFHKSIVERGRDFREPWTVNSLAQEAAIAALNDNDYASKTFHLLKEEKRYLEEGFKRMGITFFASEVNYYLLKTEKAGELTAYLYKRGILVRGCSNFAGLNESYIRVAVRTRRDNAMLLREMEKICKA